MKQFDPSMIFYISAIDEYRKLCYDKKDDAVIVNIDEQSIISQKRVSWIFIDLLRRNER